MSQGTIELGYPTQCQTTLKRATTRFSKKDSIEKIIGKEASGENNRSMAYSHLRMVAPAYMHLYGWMQGSK